MLIEDRTFDGLQSDHRNSARILTDRHTYLLLSLVRGENVEWNSRDGLPNALLPGLP